MKLIERVRDFCGLSAIPGYRPLCSSTDTSHATPSTPSTYAPRPSDRMPSPELPANFARHLAVGEGCGLPLLVADGPAFRATAHNSTVATRHIAKPRVVVKGIRLSSSRTVERDGAQGALARPLRGPCDTEPAAAKRHGAARECL